MIEHLNQALPSKIFINGIPLSLSIYEEIGQGTIRIIYQNYTVLRFDKSYPKDLNTFDIRFLELVARDIEDFIYKNSIVESNEPNEISFEQKLRDLIKEFYGKEDAITEVLVKYCVNLLDLLNEKLKNKTK